MDVICAPLLNFIALTVCHIPRHYGLALRLLDIIDVMLCNVNINPTFSIAVSCTNSYLWSLVLLSNDNLCNVFFMCNFSGKPNSQCFVSNCF